MNTVDWPWLRDWLARRFAPRNKSAAEVRLEVLLDEERNRHAETALKVRKLEEEIEVRKEIIDGLQEALQIDRARRKRDLALLSLDVEREQKRIQKP